MTVKVRIALAAAIIGVLLGAYIGFSASPSSTFMISGGIYPGAPSYTIWKEGSNYFAKNSNGELEFSGTNASQVILSANNALTDGGVIYLKSGTYQLGTTKLLLSTKVSLIGEGRDYVTLEYTGSDYAIETTTTGVFSYYSRLAGFRVKGTSSGAGGIHFFKTLYAKIEDVLVQDFTNGVGIYVDGQDKGAFWNSLYDIFVFNCSVGLKFTGTTARANQNNVFGGRIDDCATGVHIKRGQHNNFFGLDVSDGTTGFLIEDTRNFLDSPWLETLTIGLNITSDWNIIINPFFGNISGDKVVCTGSDNQFISKGSAYGFVTVNSGTATINASTTVTFDHGLAGTPTLVLCSFNSTGYGAWTWSATSTQITITVTNSGTYEVYWYAEYKP